MSVGYNIVLFLFLVNNYAAVEGEISIESCRQAAKRLLILQFLLSVFIQSHESDSEVLFNI